MSEQSKSDFKMVGAGFMGFVAVVGGAGLLLTQLSGRRAAPQAAVGTPSASSAMTASRPVSEARLSSPAPVIGSAADDVVDETAAAAVAGAQAAAESGATGVSGSALSAMGAPRFAGKGESSASAVVHKFAAKEDAQPAAAPLKPVPRSRLDKTASRGSLASTVHYGVTSRAELMGRAAGPVYNFTGRSVMGDSRLNDLADGATGKLADVEKSIDASDLTAGQKREMKARLQNAHTGAAK